VPAKRQAVQNRNSDEFRAYMDEMWRRLRVFAKRSAAVPSEERGSFEWLSAAGSFWWEARERAGLSREEFAQRLDLPLNQVRFLEFGLVTPQELSERRLHEYARALDEPALYEQFLKRFEP
jgi:ribosome-binding protein aMBF1 (putative translation factor)